MYFKHIQVGLSNGARRSERDSKLTMMTVAERWSSLIGRAFNIQSAAKTARPRTVQPFYTCSSLPTSFSSVIGILSPSLSPSFPCLLFSLVSCIPCLQENCPFDDCEMFGHSRTLLLASLFLYVSPSFENTLNQTFVWGINTNLTVCFTFSSRRS